VLRLQPRGIGGSTGPMQGVTLLDLVLGYLKRHAR
jgi:hypothetical protein